MAKINGRMRLKKDVHGFSVCAPVYVGNTGGYNITTEIGISSTDTVVAVNSTNQNTSYNTAVDTVRIKAPIVVMTAGQQFDTVVFKMRRTGVSAGTFSVNVIAADKTTVLATTGAINASSVSTVAAEYVFTLDTTVTTAAATYYIQMDTTDVTGANFEIRSSGTQTDTHVTGLYNFEDDTTELNYAYLQLKITTVTEGPGTTIELQQDGVTFDTITSTTHSIVTLTKIVKAAFKALGAKFACE